MKVERVVDGGMSEGSAWGDPSDLIRRIAAQRSGPRMPPVKRLNGLAGNESGPLASDDYARVIVSGSLPLTMYARGEDNFCPRYVETGAGAAACGSGPAAEVPRAGLAILGLGLESKRVADEAARREWRRGF